MVPPGQEYVCTNPRLDDDKWIGFIDRVPDWCPKIERTDVVTQSDTTTKGRRSDAAKQTKAAKRKKKSSKAKQKELFEKRSPKHKQIVELARELHEHREQAKEWNDSAQATENKLTALLTKLGIKGPYKADGFVLKPRETQPKKSCAVDYVGGEDDETDEHEPD